MKFYDRVLYLCVGSFYTGNYDVAIKWKAENDPENRMTIIDTGVASGKLGLVARAAAELAFASSDPSEIVAFVRGAIQNVQEYLFLDTTSIFSCGRQNLKDQRLFWRCPSYQTDHQPLSGRSSEDRGSEKPQRSGEIRLPSS